MALELFVPKKFTKAHERVIRDVNAIIVEYVEAGYSLTLRQIYYQMVAAGMIDNEYNEYKRLGEVVKHARRAGLIDWDAIEDRTRFLRGLNTWDCVPDILHETAERFKFDVWENQKVHVEVWVEKDALIGVIERVCNRYRVDYFACRGYVSDPELYGAGKRLRHYQDQGYEVVVLHLGDHDPSGMQMTEDNLNRVSLFAGEGINVKRIALSMEQIEEHRPPPQWAKTSDSRHKWYVEQFKTDKSWELDSLKPQIIDALVAEHVEELISDKDKWREDIIREAVEKNKLHGTSRNWSTVRLEPWRLDIYPLNEEPVMYDAVDIQPPFRPENHDVSVNVEIAVVGAESKEAFKEEWITGFYDFPSDTWWKGMPDTESSREIKADSIAGWRYHEPDPMVKMPWDDREETEVGDA